MEQNKLSADAWVLFTCAAALPVMLLILFSAS
jgi:hypothetical protein